MAFLLLTFCGGSFAQAQNPPVKAMRAAKHDTSPLLRDTRWDLPPLMQRIVRHGHYPKKQLKRLREKLVKEGHLEPPGSHTALPLYRKSMVSGSSVSARDSRVQRATPAESSQGGATSVIGFDGLGFSTSRNTGFFPSIVPPDANAAAGLKYVVETVNSQLAVYDKSDGTLKLGPAGLATLWANFGANCGQDSVQLISPLVLYDQLAQRWIISAVDNQTNAWCIAVSRTNDPTGAYYRYEFDFSLPSGASVDGIKMGLWPNGYYFTFNVFGAGQLKTVVMGALDRAAMLMGKGAGLVSFSVGPAAYSVLPANLDGFTPPPEGAPGLFMNYVSPNLYGSKAPYALALWRMHVDWSDPSATTLRQSLIQVPPFNDVLCGGDPACIPQPIPGGKLDSLSDRLMYRLAYRNFGNHEALVVNHTVTANSGGSPPAGIRWYELDTSAPGADDWSLKQSGTFDPADSVSRWLGSIAMDRAGDMALGYSLSGPHTSPSVAYTGRSAGDPSGKMTLPESVMAAGSGAQNPAFSNWGAYSSMALDPTDDCTFWYTQEYFSDTAPVGTNWSTHIGAFRFNACTPAPKGVLSGTVTDAASGNPVRDAHVRFEPGGAVVYTDQDGNYRIELPAGDYTATVESFGYVDQKVSVKVTDGDTVTQNITLTAAPSATLSGKVTDGSGHGYGLYAKVSVAAPDFGEVAEVWTNPADGSYSVKLPKGFKYLLTAKTVLDGYNPAASTLTLSGDATKNFALTVGGACSAPGYGFQLGGFGEDFNGTWPPPGWTVANDVSGSPIAWNLNTYWVGYGGPDPNYTGGTGTSAAVDDSYSFQMFHYSGSFDTSLESPPLPVTSLPSSPIVVYKASYGHNYADALDFGISVDGGAWQRILHWKENHGSFYKTPGERVKVNIGSFIPGDAKSIRLRWRYYDYSGYRDQYVQIDDVAIGACQPIPGGLIVGRVTDANTGAGVANGRVTDDKQGQAPLLAPTPQSAGLATGTYVLFAPPGKRALTVSAGEYTPGQAQVKVANDKVAVKDFTLGAGLLSAKPGALDVHVRVNNKKQEKLTVSNSGTASARYTLLAINTPVPATHPAATGPFATVLPARRRSASARFSICLRAMRNCGSAPTPSARNVVRPRALSADTGKPGQELAIFAPGLSFGGLVVDHDAGDLWLNSGVDIGGDGRLHRFRFDGTDTGDVIDTTSLSLYHSEDMAFDGVTGRFWMVGQTDANATQSYIYEIDPQTGAPTGKRIKVPSSDRVSGLAFDPVTNTWFAGALLDGIIYHFDSSGTLLDSVNFGKPILGLTYNPATEHLFVYSPVESQANSPDNFYVADTEHNYAILSHFDLPGLLYGGGGADSGLGHDCDGHLWASVLRDKDYVMELGSGESGWCSFKGISWLTLAPKVGTIVKGATATVEMTFDGAGQKPSTTTKAYLKLVGNTPYPASTIPITVHWDPQPINLTLKGQATPSPVHVGGNLVYTLTVTNTQAADQGAASGTELSYALPVGASYVGASGTGVACASPSGATASAPAAATGASDTVVCDLGDLAPSDSKTLTITVTANAAGTIASTFVVSARESESDASPRSLTLKTTVIGTADIAASAADASLTEGETGTLHLKVANAGPDAATGVTFKVSAGADVKLQGATSAQGSCTASGSNELSCALGDMASGASVPVNVKLLGAHAGSATVTVQATTSADDPDAGNNVATATVTIAAQSDNGGNSGNNGGGGGGSFGWLALAALLGLAVVGAGARLGRMRDST
jgi:hypothetical protein